MDERLKSIIKFVPYSLSTFKRLSKVLLQYTKDIESEKLVNKLTNGKNIPFADIFSIIPEMNEDVNDFTFLSDTSRVTDIALLMALAKTFPDCDYLEIGSFRGESLMNVLPFTKSCISISLSKNEMKKMGFGEDSIEIESILIKNDPRLNMIAHNSQTFDFNKLNKKFDLIFIDGDHRTEAVMTDTINAFKLLKNENSIIVWHDFGTHYADLRNEVIAGALAGTPEHLRRNIYRVTNTLCGIYTQRPVATLPENANLRKPASLFNVKIQSRKFA